MFGDTESTFNFQWVTSCLKEWRVSERAIDWCALLFAVSLVSTALCTAVCYFRLSQSPFTLVHPVTLKYMKGRCGMYEEKYCEFLSNMLHKAFEYALV